MALSARRLRVRERAGGLYFGWWIVAAAFGIQLLQNGLMSQSYGAYVSVLRADFGWSATALGLGFALQPVQNGLLGPLQGWMIERWGPRKVMRFGMVVFGGSFILFSQVNSLLTFYVIFVMMALGASLAGFMTITSTLVQWFERRRASAMSISQTGQSLGGALVPVVAWSLVTFGWRETAVASGLIILAVGLPLTQLIRSTPEEYGLLPDGATRDTVRPESGAAQAAGANSVEARVDFTPRQALHTRSFWFISLGHALALLVVSAVMVHLIVHLEEGMHFSLAGASLVVTAMTLVTAIGQLAGGFLGDRFDKRMIAALAMFGHSVGLLALAWGNSLAWVIFFVLAHGMAWGMRGPLMQAMRADYFGRRHFATIMGYSSMVIMWGMITGPIVAGVMADRFGDYRYGFTILALLAGLGSIFFVFATKPPPPASHASSH